MCDLLAFARLLEWGERILTARSLSEVLGDEGTPVVNEAEARSYLISGAVVDLQMVVSAKAIVLAGSASTTRVNELMAQVFEAAAVRLPDRIILNPAVDPIPQLDGAAAAFGWRLAAIEAIWGLVNASLLLPIGGERPSVSLAWTTVYGNSGGISSGWTFPEFSLPFPTFVQRVPSFSQRPYPELSDKDLFLGAINVAGMHPELQHAVRETVKCLRAELFTAALAMLGKVSEGAWLELGAALVSAVPPHAVDSIKKQREILEDPLSGAARKIDAVLKLYDRQDLFEPVSTRCGIRPQELRSSAVWSDAVRDSRNTIHFGVAPAVPTPTRRSCSTLGSIPELAHALRDSPGRQMRRSGPVA